MQSLFVMPVRCSERDCIRLPWRDGRCWWCWMALAARQGRAKSSLDSRRDSNPSLGPMTHEDHTREG